MLLEGLNRFHGSPTSPLRMHDRHPTNSIKGLMSVDNTITKFATDTRERVFVC